MTTIDMLRNPSIRAVLTAAARNAPPPTSTRPAFTLRNVPAGISLTRAADLMEATAAAAGERKQRAGRKGWQRCAKWHTLTFTFYWEPHPPADEPAVIAQAVDVLRAAELQAAIVRGADDDGPCTILMFNTIQPATGLVHRSRDSYTDLLRWHFRREGTQDPRPHARPRRESGRGAHRGRAPRTRGPGRGRRDRGRDRQPHRGRRMGRAGGPGRRPSRPVPPRGRAGRPHPAPVGALGRRGRWRTRGGLSGRTAAWRWRSRAECNTARAWPTPVTGYHRRAAGTHGRHRSRGAGHGAASGRDGRHTQGEA